MMISVFWDVVWHVCVWMCSLHWVCVRGCGAGPWCGAMCVRVRDDVEWAEEEYGEGDGDRACLHVHRWWGVRVFSGRAYVICVCCAWVGDGAGWACRRARACSHVMISVFWGVVWHVCVWMCSLKSNALGAAGATAVAPHLASLTALRTLK